MFRADPRLAAMAQQASAVLQRRNMVASGAGFVPGSPNQIPRSSSAQRAALAARQRPPGRSFFGGLAHDVGHAAGGALDYLYNYNPLSRDLPSLRPRPGAVPPLPPRARSGYGFRP